MNSSAPRAWSMLGIFALILVFALSPDYAWAALDDESQFVLNSFSFLIWGALVM